WLGVSGENANRWDTWTAGVTGIAQFHPNGAAQPVPWTWGPIAVPAGQGIYTVGVYEIVYWAAGKPDYQWQYGNAGTTAPAAGRGGGGRRQPVLRLLSAAAACSMGRARPALGQARPGLPASSVSTRWPSPTDRLPRPRSSTASGRPAASW